MDNQMPKFITPQPEVQRLCDDCIGFLASRFTEMDMAVLYNLKGTTFVKGYSLVELHRKLLAKAEEREEINKKRLDEDQAWIRLHPNPTEEELKKKPDVTLMLVVRPSKGQIYDSLNKFMAMGFTEYIKKGMSNYFFITKDGDRAITYYNMMMHYAKSLGASEEKKE